MSDISSAIGYSFRTIRGVYGSFNVHNYNAHNLLDYTEANKIILQQGMFS